MFCIMAENKNSFLLYLDQRGIFDQLPDEYAGKLIKHIYAYVHDEDPETEDLILKMAFEGIKMALKRDLKKYETYLEKQRVNGAKGGRPNKPKETEKTQAFFQEPKKPDSVSVSVSVSDSESDNEKVKRKKFVPPTLEQCIEYAHKRGFNEQFAQKFYDTGLKTGWVVGKAKTPMKNWEAAMRTWELEEWNQRFKINQTTQSTQYAKLT